MPSHGLLGGGGGASCAADAWLLRGNAEEEEEDAEEEAESFAPLVLDDEASSGRQYWSGDWVIIVADQVTTQTKGKTGRKRIV